jgi:flagellum-specific ATP synthase
MSINFERIYQKKSHLTPYREEGHVLETQGMVYRVSLKSASLGSRVSFESDEGATHYGEVIEISSDSCLVMPYQEFDGINSRTKVYCVNSIHDVFVCTELLGRVIDAFGNPLDGKGPIKSYHGENRSLVSQPINPLDRPPITEALNFGVRSIDSFVTIGKGQRMSILAGSGIGKSVLLGMMAKNSSAQVNVISLVGERGREVREFIENDLGPEGLARSVVIVATSDTGPLTRIRAAYAATTIAEYFRDQSKDVLLMMDSITRFAMAAREVSLSAGDPPGQKGYTPSVFARLPKLLERAGRVEGKGSITGIYTVLVEGGDMDEPVTDAIRAISDGHIQLSRALAAKNHYPAIDVLSSISRVMNKVVSREHRIVASHLRDLMSAYQESEDLISVGAYTQGTNPRVDKAIRIYDEIINFLRQSQDEEQKQSLDEVFDNLIEIARKAEAV